MDFQAFSTLDRRSFLRRAGLGSIALASLPGLFTAGPALARGRAAGFNFTAISRAATIGGVAHAVNMAGSGTIEEVDVEGGGHFTTLHPPRRGRSSAQARGRRSGL